MIHVSGDKKTFSVTIDNFSAADLLVTQQALINLVKNCDNLKNSEGDIYCVLGLLEELLPDEDQLKMIMG